MYGGTLDEEKEEDKKFEDMMLSFSRLSGQLSAQQQQLGSVIKQVNALVDHRDKKENQIMKMGQKNEFKKIRDKGLKKSMTTQ